MKFWTTPSGPIYSPSVEHSTMPTYKDPSTNPHPPSFDALPLSAGVDGYLGLWGVVGEKSFLPPSTPSRSPGRVVALCLGVAKEGHLFWAAELPGASEIPLPGFAPWCVESWCQQIAPGGRCSIQAGRALRLMGVTLRLKQSKCPGKIRKRFSLFSYGSVWIWLGEKRCGGFVRGWHQEQVSGSGMGYDSGHALFSTWHWHLLLWIPLSQVRLLVCTTPAAGRVGTWETHPRSCMVHGAAHHTYEGVDHLHPFSQMAPGHPWVEHDSGVLGAIPLDGCDCFGSIIWLAYSK